MFEAVYATVKGNHALEPFLNSSMKRAVYEGVYEAVHEGV